MNVRRQFDWRDFPTLHRYRNESIFLDSALLLTRGSQLMVPAPCSLTWRHHWGCLPVCRTAKNSTGSQLIGQFIHLAGSPFSHLTFLRPQTRWSRRSISPLVEYMMALSGERGALRLLADVDEQSSGFRSAAQMRFAVYTRQRIWQLDRTAGCTSRGRTWRPAC